MPFGRASPGLGRDVPLVAIDANLLDPDGTARDDVVARFRDAVGAGRLRVFVPSGVFAELRHPHTPATVRNMADRVAAASARASALRLTARQHIDRIRVRAVMRGDGRPGKHDADAAHLSEALEAGCHVFLTRDGKILRKRDILRSALQLDLAIMTLEDLMNGFDHED